MTSLVFVASPGGDSVHQPDVIQARSDDAAVATVVQQRIDARRAEIDAAEAQLKALCAQSAREELYAGSGARLGGEIVTLANRVQRLEGEIEFLQTALHGLAG